MWLQFFVAIFCIFMLILCRDSFAEKELVELRRDILELRRKRNKQPKGSREWHDLNLQLKDKEKEYKDSLGDNNLRW